jgi:hypothetical protein
VARNSEVHSRDDLLLVGDIVVGVGHRVRAQHAAQVVVNGC